ncbi:hypothetical protein LIER_20687 [Lithospermum erythrorhizon]|uniref:Uncharacterized protein n=1 Tax=Lithospermum erythrorhizon TaxID=34254 RepID=A0AAV3QME6_LITER
MVCASRRVICGISAWRLYMQFGHSFRRKHPSSDPMDAFSLSALYMIKVSSKKTHAELEAAQVCLNERDEELNSCKEALSAEEAKCHKLREEKQTMELEHVKSCSTLEAELEKLKRDQSSLGEDVEGSRSAVLAATTRAEEAEAHAAEAKARLSPVDEEVAQQVAEFKDSEEGDLFVGKESASAFNNFPPLAGMYNEFKKSWSAEYFEGL